MSEGSNKKPVRGRRRRPSNQRRRSGNRNKNNSSHKKNFKLTGIELTLNKYQNLFEQYLNSRKKYFDLFDRADPNQKAKLERIYYSNCQKLRDFEASLTEEEKKAFDERGHALNTDTIYSDLHLDEKALNVPTTGDFDETHLLSSQRNHNYSNDTEESVGSMDDYEKYKAENP